MWDVSSEAADLWYNIFNGLLIGGALAIFVGTFGSIKMGSAKEYFANVRLSENERATAEAKERTAALEKEAVGLRIELSKVKVPVVARGLSGTAAEILVKELTGSGLHVPIFVFGDGEEATNLGRYFEGAFRQAGVLDRFTPGARFTSEHIVIPDGVSISGPPSMEKTHLERAFNAAGIKFVDFQKILTGSADEDRSKVFIGPRPSLPH